VIGRLRWFWWRVRYGRIAVGFDAADGIDSTVIVAYRQGRYRVLKTIIRDHSGGR
jgi:hypothetical protein